MSEIQFLSTTPVLASLDLAKTEKFYQEKLGFKTVSVYDGYLIMSRGGIGIHFWKCDDKYIAENTSCYIYVKNIDSLYDEYKIAGIIHPNGALKEQFYGMKDFAILDEDGNLIKFGEDMN